MAEFQLKYMEENNFEISLPANKKIIGGSPKNLKRSEVKKNMQLFERGLALVPDSTSSGRETIDSFYSNKFKIKYIKDHKLESKNIFLLEPE